MKGLFLLLSLCQINLYCYCQYNLVPNFSFEDSVVCPSQPLFVSDTLPKPWYIPSNFQDGYFAHECSSWLNAKVPYNTIGGFPNFQYAKTGKGYALFSAVLPTDNRSYLQIKLKDSLLNNHCYYCEFWVNLPNPCNRASNNIAMWLTKTAIYSDTIANPFGTELMPANPQIVNYGNAIITDTMNWVKVSGIYSAQGGEQYITIGNFKDDANTTSQTVNTGGTDIVSYLVDDVSVIPFDSMPLKADAGKDTTIASGDSVFIGSFTNGITNIKWYNATGQLIDSARPGFYVKPTSNTFYVVAQTVCGYTSKDTVNITLQAMPVHLIFFTGRQQGEKVKLQWTVENEQNFDRYEVERNFGRRNFIKVGEVTADNRRQYSFLDSSNTWKDDKLFYRLNLIDKDGSYKYSPIIHIEMSKKNGIAVFPNPAKSVVNIKANNLKKIELLNAVGAVVRSQNANGNSISISIDNLSSGVFIIRITDTNSKVIIKKIFKNLY